MTRHLAAALGATPAGFCTFLAVIHRVLAALFRAGIADLGAQVANVAGKFAAARHHAGGVAANLSALDVERDTSRHCSDVLFFEAGGGAVIARIRAFLAGLNAVLVLLVCHEIFVLA